MERNQPNAVIRKLTIDMVTDSFNPIVEYFDSVWDQLYRFRTDVYKDYSNEYIYFYYSNQDIGIKKWVFYLDEQTRILYYNHNNFGNHLCHKFDLIPDEADVIVSILFSKAMDMNILSSVMSASDNSIIAVALNLYKGSGTKMGKSLQYVRK